MSHLNPGLISAYNSLTDKHLAGYFSNTRIRRHLQRAGLITRSGRIVPDKEYRHKLIQRAHQRHVRECLAQAIFHKVLEMERVHQIEIKRKLEEFARRERVHKIKVERSKRYEEEIRILSPHPPMGARVFRKQHSGPEGDHTESSESPGSSRPNTAPGKMQRPVRLEPIHSNSTTASLRPGSPYRLLETNKNEQPFNSTVRPSHSIRAPVGKESRRRLTTMDVSQGISPYCLPVINNFVTPVPPATKRKDRGGKPTPSSTLRGRRLRPTTASSGADELPLLRSSVYQSRVCVNMVYFGKAVHLSNDLTDMRDEVKVFQQHCGGENLCVYKGRLREGEMFQFISRRHRGFPFSLTFFLNGLQVERLSSCCEFKHRKGSRLGGRHGHFGFCSVEGASPCYKCIIAMGLDKKPTPPPKRVKDDGRREESVSSPKDTTEMETERTVEDAVSHSECETSRPRDIDTPVKDKTTNVEDKIRDDYEEDFEADDEGPAEDPEEKEKEASSPAAETEVKQKDASESEDDVEDEDARSHSGSSSAGSNKEESGAEAPKDPGEDEDADQSKEADQEEAAAPAAEKEEANPEEAAATKAESVVAKDSSDLPDSAADSTEIDISDTSALSGTGNKQTDDTSADKEDETTEEGSKQEEEQERAKSVQEKLAEAILKESHCSSEPELSDTSTEEEEESTNKGHEQNNEDAVPETSEPKCKESIISEAEEEHEETSSAQEQKEEEEEPHESSDGIQDEAVKEEDAEKVSSEVKADVADQEKTEETEGAVEALPPASEEETPEAPEVQGDAAAKAPDAEAAEKDEGGEEQAAVDEAEAKGPEEDESSVSEMNQKADEAAGETITEMKADHSEEQEALGFEEAPEGDTEGRREDEEDVSAGLETEVTAENSSSSSEGSGDTTVQAEKTERTSQDDVKDETREEEEAPAAEASKSESEKQTGDAGEETTERSEGTEDEVEKEKSEEESKGEEKEIHSNEILGENTEKEETVEREEEGDEKITAENEGNDDKSDLNIEEKSNKEALVEEVSNGEKEDRETKGKTEERETEDDEVDKRVTNKDAEEESEEKEAVKNTEEELNTTDDKQTGEAEEMEEKEAVEDEVSEDEKKDNEEEIIIRNETEDGRETSEVPEETMKRDEVGNDVLKMPDENIESEVADHAEAAEGGGRSSTAEESLNKESEKESHEGERGEMDIENGEMSTTLESKSTRPETPAEEKNDQTSEQTAEEKETDKENLEATAEEPLESLDTTEKQNVELTPPTAEEGINAEEGDAIVEKQDEDDKQEPSSPEVKEESEPSETKDKEADEKKENIEPEDSEDVSPEEQVRPSTAIEPVDTQHNEDNEEKAVGVEPLPADGENGAGTEEASRASEEGASVLLKPQAQPATLGDAGGAQTPETLEKENSADLVTNWVTLHQASNYFETFVEPLEELRGSERPGSASPCETAKTSEGEAADGNQSATIHVEEAAPSSRDGESVRPAAEEPGEKEEVKDTATDAEDEPCVVDSVMELTKEDEETEESKGAGASLAKEKIQDVQTPKDVEENEIVRIEVESNEGTNHSGASGKPESIAAEKPTEEGRESHQEQPEETKSPTSPESEEHHERSQSPDRVSAPTDAKPEDERHVSEKNEEERQEVTEVTEFAKSEVGSQQETNAGEAELRLTTDGSVDGDRRDAQLIHQIRHTISKERLGTFSVDETLFGRSSYPLLTAAARTESGH